MSSSHPHDDDQQSSQDAGSGGVPRGGPGSVPGAGSGGASCARAADMATHPDDLTFLIDALPFVSVGVDQRTRTLAIVLSDGEPTHLVPPVEGEAREEARYPAILLNERSAIHFIRSAQEALQHLSRLPLLPR